jgi:signal transduction histidine kinase
MCIKLATRYFYIAFLGVCLLLCPFYTKAQQNYTFERINSESGLPANTIKGIEFDEVNRFLWVATESGIVRYNGTSFQTFGDVNNTSKLNGRIASLDKKNDGTIFGRFLDESVFYIDHNLPVIDPKNSTLNFYDTYLEYKYNLPSQIIQNVSKNISITYSDFKINNNLYFLSENFDEINLIRVLPGKDFKIVKKFYNGEQFFVINNKLFFLQNNRLVLEVNDDFDNKFEFKNVKTLTPYINTNKSIKIFRNGKDDIYLLNHNSLYSINYFLGQIIVKLITNQIPVTEDIRFLKLDKMTNAIFLGTDNRGLIIGHPSYFNRVLHTSALDGTSSAAYAQVLLSNGNIQINSGQKFGKSNVPATNIFYRPSSTNTFTSKDNIFYYSNSDGIIEYDLKLQRVKQISKEIKEGRISFIEFKDHLYGFSEKGIYKKEKNNNWSCILRFKSIPTGFIVHQVVQFSEDELLLATTDGLYKYHISNRSFKRIFRDNNGANFRAIYNLDGYFLIGTYGGGIYMMKGDVIKKMPFDQNKYLSYTHCFIKDDQNRIWASTNKGLFMSPAKSLIDFWEFGPGNISFQYFGKLEGIDVLEMNGGCTPCVIQLPNGHFSFPGIDGLIQFNPNDIKEINIKPNLFLDKIIIDYNLVINNILKEELSPNTKNIEFQFGISGMLSQENIMFEYKIDNGSWSRLGVKNPSILVSNPGFGTHLLTVRIRNTINKQWITKIYDFNIGYPWYLNPWMYIVYVFGMIGLVLIYIRFKTLIYQRRQKMLESEVAVKTASLNEINDYLQKRNQAKDHVIAIMNHDILTPLKYLHITAKNTADQIEEAGLKHSIDQIARTSKQLEYLTSNMLNWVKFENINELPNRQTIDLHQFVQGLLEFVAPFRLNDKIKIENKIPLDIEIFNWPDALRVILYNIIVNAIKSTKKGLIEVSYHQTTTDCTIVIADSGEGMSESMVYYLLSGHSKDQVELLPKYKKGNGFGYQIIRHLVKLMQANLQITSKENMGTIVTLKFKTIN